MPFPDLLVLMISHVRKLALVSSLRCSRCVFSFFPLSVGCFMFDENVQDCQAKYFPLTSNESPCICFTPNECVMKNFQASNTSSITLLAVFFVTYNLFGELQSFLGGREKTK